jgi:phosphoribosylformylglycinamidine cyclo-ligase
MTQRPVTYADAGVDIDAGEEAVERIVAGAKKTHIPGVLGGVGGFGGLFALKDALVSLEDPVLVSGTDGVGTKLLVAVLADKHDTIGQDLVAMCVNDVLTTGARPLFFLDYYATGKLLPQHMASVVLGIAKACEQSGCALIGGETAELPGLYEGKHYDLAGFAVGAVDRKKIVDGTQVKPGDLIVGLSSSGLHSNGYSLARRVILDVMKKGIHDKLGGAAGDKTVADVMLEPTRLYVKPILKLLESGARVHAMAHITGGGIPMNLTRSFPAGTAAVVDPSTWTEPPIFRVLREGGPVEEAEMRRTFNCGIGFCVVLPKDDADRAIALLAAQGEEARVIGEVVPGKSAGGTIADGEVGYR